MKHIAILALTAVLAACGGEGKPEAAPGPAVSKPPIVDAAWLREHRDEVVVVGMHRSRETFEKGHVPGAVYADVEDFRTKDKLLKPRAELERRLGELGIDADTYVVAYDDRDGYNAGWLWFILTQLGHGAVSLLDGNIGAWEGLETGPPPEVEEKTSRARRDPPDIVDADYVQARMGKSIIVDARVPEQYTGEKPKKGMKGGHVPGAINVPWNTFHDESGRYLDVPAARAALASRVDGEPWKDNEVILYCNSYHASSHLHFHLARLGYTNLKAYDGSMKDWEARDLPLKKGEQP